MRTLSRTMSLKRSPARRNDAPLRAATALIKEVLVRVAAAFFFLKGGGGACSVPLGYKPHVTLRRTPSHQPPPPARGSVTRQMAAVGDAHATIGNRTHRSKTCVQRRRGIAKWGG